MDALLVKDLIQEACIAILKIGAPVLLIGLLVGFVISLIQALTQVQEMTISFVPKLIAILATIVFASSYMSTTLMKFTHKVYNQITVQPYEGQ